MKQSNSDRRHQDRGTETNPADVMDDQLSAIASLKQKAASGTDEDPENHLTSAPEREERDGAPGQSDDLNLLELFYDEAARHALLTKAQERNLGQRVERSQHLRQVAKSLPEPTAQAVTDRVLSQIFQALLAGEPFSGLEETAHTGAEDADSARTSRNSKGHTLGNGHREGEPPAEQKTLAWLTEDADAVRTMEAPLEQNQDRTEEDGDTTPARILLARHLALLPPAALARYRTTPPGRALKDISSTDHQKWALATKNELNEHYRNVRADGHNAREVFTLSNMRLVMSMARAMSHFGLPMSDLIQEGTIGLMRAAKGFDHRRGWRFSTYATWWIRQAMNRAIADQARVIRLPAHMKERVNRTQRAWREATADLNRDPTPAEVAERMGVSVRTLEQTKNYGRETLSLDLRISDEHDITLKEIVEDSESETTEQLAEKSAASADIARVLSTLSPRQQLVIQERFGLLDGREKTLQHLGEALGISRERVRQIEAKALRTLRNSPITEMLRDYLDT